MRCKQQGIDGEIGMFDKSPGIKVVLCSAGKVIVAVSQTQDPQKVLLPISFDTTGVHELTP